MSFQTLSCCLLDHQVNNTLDFCQNSDNYKTAQEFDSVVFREWIQTTAQPLNYPHAPPGTHFGDELSTTGKNLNKKKNGITNAEWCSIKPTYHRHGML